MNVHERQRVVDTDDQKEFMEFDLDIEGEVRRVSLGGATPLVSGRLSPAVCDVLSRRHGVTASNTDTWHDGGRSRLWVSRLDAVGDLGTVDAVLSADERSPGRFVVDLLGYVAIEEPDDWLSVGYLQMVRSSDPEVVGVVPQMKEFHDPPRKSLYGDGTYTRRYRDVFPPDLRLDLFEMDREARHTDVVHASWLRASGRFVSRRYADLLREFVVPDVTYLDLDVHQSGALVPLVFAHIFDSTMIDYANSQFLASGGIHNDYRERFAVESSDALLTKRDALVRLPERPRVEPQSIRFERRPDLVRIGLDADPFVSHRLARRMAAENVTGVELRAPTFLIG